MSTVLDITDLQPVADLLERLQNVQRAMRDLHDAHEDGLDARNEFSVSITGRDHLRDWPVANTHTLSYWVVLQGLAAMERELIQQLHAKDIDVASALPM